jgi:hypothetical protein
MKALFVFLVAAKLVTGIVLQASSFISGGNGTAALPWEGGVEKALSACTLDCVVLVCTGHWIVDYMDIRSGTSVVGSGFGTVIHHAPKKATKPMGSFGNFTQLRDLVVNGSRFDPSVNTSITSMTGGFTILGDQVLVDSVLFADFSAYGALCHCDPNSPARHLVVRNNTFKDCWVGFHSGGAPLRINHTIENNTCYGTHPGATNKKDKPGSPMKGDKWIHNCIDYDNNNNPGDLIGVVIRNNRVVNWGNLGIAIACGRPTRTENAVVVADNIIGDESLPYPQRQGLHFEQWCVNLTVANNSIRQTAGNSPLSHVISGGYLHVFNNSISNCSAMGGHAGAPCMSVGVGTSTYCGEQGNITEIAVKANSIREGHCANGITIARQLGCSSPPFADSASLLVLQNNVTALFNGTGISVKNLAVQTSVDGNRINSTLNGIVVVRKTTDVTVTASGVIVIGGSDSLDAGGASPEVEVEVEVVGNKMSGVAHCIAAPPNSRVEGNACN